MTDRLLHVAPKLYLPRDTVTSTLIVYGGKGMGKTNFGGALTEELAAAGLRFAVLDPMGVWWGLRHSEDGKGPGIPVLILGGIHGDIPIEPTAGAVVADLVVDEDVSVVIDISRRPNGTMWSIGERVRFVTDYAKRLYQRQGEKRRPIMQVLDEAARFIPQVIRKGDEQVAACMGAVAVLVEEGRNVGVGVCLITQRSARLNKDVAELADCMIAFRTVGPNSRRAVLDWLGEHVEKEKIKTFDEQVRALPRGSALVVSPGWLEIETVVAMRARTTFDSSATPQAGKERRAAGLGAQPDLAKYQQRMAATIERVQADDPKVLRQRIAELTRAMEKRLPPLERKVAAAEKVKTVTVDRLVVTAAQLKALNKAIVGLQAAATDYRHAVDWLDNQVARPLLSALEVYFKDQRRPVVVEKPGRTVTVGLGRPSHLPDSGGLQPVRGPSGGRIGGPKADRPIPSNGRALPKGERLVLTAIAQHADGVSRQQLTVLTGYKRSTRDAYVARLSERGLLLIAADRIEASGAGIAALGKDFEPLPTGRLLLDHWLSHLPDGERKVLEIVVNAYPDAVGRETIGVLTTYARSSRDAYLQRLQARALVLFEGRGAVRASPVLFD